MYHKRYKKNEKENMEENMRVSNNELQYKTFYHLYDIGDLIIFLFHDLMVTDGGHFLTGEWTGKCGGRTCKEG